MRPLSACSPALPFENSERLCRFLRFVVKKTLDGEAADIKEYLIALEVYGRGPSYDPKVDSIVRVEASRLRTKLREYYETDGRDDEVRIDLPKGSYVPLVRSIPKAQSRFRSTYRPHSSVPPQLRIAAAAEDRSAPSPRWHWPDSILTAAARACFFTRSDSTAARVRTSRSGGGSAVS